MQNFTKNFKTCFYFATVPKNFVQDVYMCVNQTEWNWNAFPSEVLSGATSKKVQGWQIDGSASLLFSTLLPTSARLFLISLVRVCVQLEISTIHLNQHCVFICCPSTFWPHPVFFYFPQCRNTKLMILNTN